MAVRRNIGTVIVGRLAPSPSGELHLGHAFAFTIAFVHTKSRGGKLVLRHEDVDVERAKKDHIEKIRDDLLWLGLEWDEERVQSSRLPILVEAAKSLFERTLAYACQCTRGDLRAFGAPQEGQTEVAYPGTCRDKKLSPRDNALRFVATPELESVEDIVFGTQSFDVARESGDFLILRKNGLPSYQLAVTLDDAFDGVTEVVRGADLLPSTARQRKLRRAFGFPEPSHLHVPLVTDEHGVRLAKRVASLSLAELRRNGATPGSIARWVAGAIRSETPPARIESPRDLLGSFDARQLRRENIRVTDATLRELTAR